MTKLKKIKNIHSFLMHISTFCTQSEVSIVENCSQHIF